MTDILSHPMAGSFLLRSVLNHFRSVAGDGVHSSELSSARESEKPALRKDSIGIPSMQSYRSIGGVVL